MDFPSLKAPRLLALLQREPLGYTVTRQRGSHRRLESANGYPPLGFSFHDRVTVGPHIVRKILVHDIGLDEQQAHELARS